jgi:hypothetical protein
VIYRVRGGEWGTQGSFPVFNRISEAITCLEALATTDPLTGLPNHRALMTAIDQELECVHRYGYCRSLLFLDVRQSAGFLQQRQEREKRRAAGNKSDFLSGMSEEGGSHGLVKLLIIVAKQFEVAIQPCQRGS